MVGVGELADMVFGVVWTTGWRILFILRYCIFGSVVWLIKECPRGRDGMA